MSRNLVLAIVLLIASSFFWSGNFFSGKIAFLSDLSPFKLSFFRWILALLILLPFTYAQIIKDLEYYKKNILLMTVISILGVTIFNSFTYISLRTTMVINSTLMASVAPVMMIGFSWLIFRTKTTTLQFTGIILSLLGAFAIILAIALGALAAWMRKFMSPAIKKLLSDFRNKDKTKQEEVKFPEK